MRLSSFVSKKRIAFLLIVAVVAIAGIVLLVQQIRRTQELRSRAAATTTIRLIPSEISATTGTPLTLDVVVSPDTNIITVLNLEITYDPALLTPDPAPFENNPDALPLILEGPIVSNGKILLTLAVDGEVIQALATEKKVGTLRFNPIGQGNTQVSFGSSTQAFSADSDGSFEQNAISSTFPATITISGEGDEATPESESSPTTTDTEFSSTDTQNPPNTTLGDINEDGIIDVFDYNILADCGFAASPELPMEDPQSVYNQPSCTVHPTRANADLDQNGTINEIDYNIFLRSNQNQ